MYGTRSKPSTTRRALSAGSGGLAAGGGRRPRLALQAALLAAAALGMLRPLPGQSPFPSETVVDALAHNGTRYEAGATPAGAGATVAHAGDVNGDGRPDILIGSAGAGGDAPGTAWVVFGGGLAPPRFPLPLIGERGVRIHSGINVAGTPDRFGAFVAGAGDVDGDGVDDFLVGAPSELGPEFPRGLVFLVFGSRRLPERLSAVDLVGGSGVLLHEPSASGTLGATGAGVGDLNADGYGDMALGVPDASSGPPESPARTGRVRIIFGGPHLRRLPLVTDIADLEPFGALDISGTEDGGAFGLSCGKLGDINADGFDDVGVGAPTQGAGGAVYVIFGHGALAESAVDLDVADPSIAVEFRSTITGALLGEAVAGGRDVTGDGVPDLVVGAPLAPRNGAIAAGAAMVVAGGTALDDDALRLLPAEALFVLGGARGDEAGTSVAVVPDLTGDGTDEVLVGAPARDSGRGAAYLAFGGPDLVGHVVPGDLSPPFGARFLHQQQAARLGRSVAGIADRDGDGRGDLLLGAPRLRLAPEGAGGGVYEVLGEGEPQAPRNVDCSNLPDGRVLLTWMVPRLVRELRVYRDGLPLTGPLPSGVLRFIDTAVPPGRHQYVVEVNGDPELRSTPCEIDVRPLEVRDLHCEQEPGTTRVRVGWVPGDRYGLLRVVVNGNPLRDLPPDATSFTFDLGEGRFDVEVYDPTTDPAGLSAECTTDVVAVPVGGIEEFRCELIGERRVLLGWSLSPEFSEVLVGRDGVSLARVRGESMIDEDVPSGELHYTIVGLSGGIHTSPPVHCAVDVPRPGPNVVRGNVAFDDRESTPVARGTVAIRRPDGALVTRVQVDQNGEFEAAVPGEGPFDVAYSIDVPSLSSGPGGPLQGDLTTLAAQEELVPAGGLAELRLPLPVLAVAASRAGLRHWDGLRGQLANRAIMARGTIPAGSARGAIAIERQVDSLVEHVREHLGAAPSEIDLVAYGLSGLAARLYLHTAPTSRVARLVLLGVPNEGTPRAWSEVRGDLPSEPPPGGLEAPAGARYGAAKEQTPKFLQEFNARVHRVRGATVHLVAGSAGAPELVPLLGCQEHDGRVCSSSATGGVPGATIHIVEEGHASLGRGARSLSVLETEVGLGRRRREGAKSPGDGGDGAAPKTLLLDGGAEGEGGGFEPPEEGGSYSLARIFSGELQPGDEGLLPLLADTSGSIIIILSVQHSSGLPFSVITPSAETIDPFTAAASGVEYVSYVDGEGSTVQSYSFPTAAAGEYEAQITNPVENPAVDYTLEIHVQSTLVLSAQLDEEELDRGASTVLRAELRDDTTPRTGALVRAEVARPDGSLLFLELADDGAAPDAEGGDGRYAAVLEAGARPGVHSIQVLATDDEAAPTFVRTATAQLVVRSDAASFGGDWESGSVDDDTDGRADRLWVAGEVIAQRGGTFLVLGRLADEDGQPVAESGTVFSLDAPQTAQFQISFDGAEIAAAHLDGPYVLAEIELFDAEVGFVPADRAVDVHVTDGYPWWFFGLDPGVEFVRGDSNSDGEVDISDASFTLLYLFRTGDPPTCFAAADTNADDEVDISDPIYLLSFLFLQGDDVPAPYPDCGTAGAASCESYAHCPQSP